MAGAIAAAVLPIGGLACTGRHAGAAYAGQALFDLITTGPDEAAPDEPAARAMLPLVARGALGELPGTLRLYGRMQSAEAEAIGFEAYLGPAGEGIGSLWYDGRRRDEAIVDVVLLPGGFAMRDAQGAESRFSCGA